jgi:hypothetical protein
MFRQNMQKNGAGEAIRTPDPHLGSAIVSRFGATSGAAPHGGKRPGALEGNTNGNYRTRVHTTEHRWVVALLRTLAKSMKNFKD